MKSFAAFAILGAAIAPAFASVVARQSKGNLPAVSVKGNAFFAGDERFYVRGVAYQPGMWLSYNQSGIDELTTLQAALQMHRTLSLISSA